MFFCFFFVGRMIFTYKFYYFSLCPTAHSCPSLLSALPAPNLGEASLLLTGPSPLLTPKPEQSLKCE